jgi:GTP pyrophosphokinase
VTEKDITSIDSDGPAVYALVMEVTIRGAGATREPKDQYLRRIMLEGSPRARLLKLADRISNLWALGFVHDVVFVRKYIEETKSCILPYAERVNADMFRELSDLVSSREYWLPLIDGKTR